jgi:hypothetical protein
MYILLKSTSSNTTLVANYLSKYTQRLEFAGVLYQLRFVQPLLLMWLCRFIFGNCLPLSLALHHLLTTINRATATPIFAQHHISTEPVHLILHTPNITPLWGGGLDSLLNTQGRAHTIAQCLEYPGTTHWPAWNSWRRPSRTLIRGNTGWTLPIMTLSTESLWVEWLLLMSILSLFPLMNI